MQTATASDSQPSAWTRFWRRLAEIEDDMSRGYDGLQDKRIDYLEGQLAILKQEVAALQASAPKRE